MADEHRQVPSNDLAKVGELGASGRDSTPEPTLPAADQPQVKEFNQEIHSPTGQTATRKEGDAESRNSAETLTRPPRESAIQSHNHLDINHQHNDALYVPHNYRNTGTWTDSAAHSKMDYDVETNEVDPNDGIDWRPGFRSQFPWIGFAGLVTIIVATSMAVAILGSSNHKRVSEWPFKKFPIQPNVLLNIANQVQNLGLITLIAQGLAVAWWRKALLGSSLSTLHRNHAYSYSFFSIITSGRHFNIIALAALMTKFAVIDSTLFQKATKTAITQQVNYDNATVSAWIETKWSANRGGIPGDDGSIKTVDAAWATVLDAYNGKIANGKVHDSLEGNASFFDCPYRQECSGKIKAIGFAFKCNTETENVDYGLQRSSQQGGNSTSYPLWDIDFVPTWATRENPYASVQLQMLYVDSHAGPQNGSCPGTLTRRTCQLRPALVEYPVTIMTPSKEELAGKNIVTHIKFFNDNKAWPLGAPLDTEQIDGLKVLEYADLNEQFGTISTVGALTYVLSNLYSSSANLTFENDWNIASRGSQAQNVFYADNDKDDQSRCYYDIDKPGRDDPAIEILRKVNTLSFVTGLYLNGAPTTDVRLREKLGMSHQSVTTAITGIVEEYKTSFAYVGGALAATIVTVLLVLPVYWGFWQLGRKVTLGPLEISHAFNAPIIAPEKTKNHHGDFDQVLQEVGKRKVRYGQLKGAPPGQMGLAEPERVQMPDVRHRGEVLGGRSNQRLAMGAAFGGVAAMCIGGSAK
jgi:hypothetical protein